MHIHTIAAFAFLFWRMEEPGDWRIFGPHQTIQTLVFVLGHLILTLALGYAAARRTSVLFERTNDVLGRAARFHHRATSMLRLFLVAGFGASVLLTPWPDWFSLRSVTPALQVFGDLAAMSPYFAGAIGLWILGFPIERKLHRGDETDASAGQYNSWSLIPYLNFHVRHHLLVIAAPMSLILLAANLTHAYEEPLRSWSGSYWTPDLLLGLSAAVVFLISPLILRRVWSTVPLESGPLRDSLQAVCDRVGLRCREILVWKSDGLMINAAVMGIVPAARYVLLSDALLDSMSPRQVEAVFGHEAGHVRHRHMQHFLVFALVGWLAAGTATEGLTWWFHQGSQLSQTEVGLIQAGGLAFTFLFWMAGFGWLSRRFERQADLFGARCVTPGATECHLPCSVHIHDGNAAQDKDRVCATGAAVFASALDKVATLSGIGHDEPSWRHSSVGNRIRFLVSAAGDPNRAVDFEQLIRRAKTGLLLAAVVGSLGAAYYWKEIRPIPVGLTDESAQVRRLLQRSPEGRSRPHEGRNRS